MPHSISRLTVNIKSRDIKVIGGRALKFQRCDAHVKLNKNTLIGSEVIASDRHNTDVIP